MKKSFFIRAGKAGLALAGALVIGLTIWANWEESTYTQQNTQTAVYKTYDISNVKPEQYSQIEKRISLLNGVTACSLNSTDKLLGIMFITSKISGAEMNATLNTVLGSKISEREFGSKTGGCPVTGVKYLVLHIRDVFRFRS